MFSSLERPPKEKVGLKFVLFRIQAKDYVKGFDFGFANWNGTGWDEVDQSLMVWMWAELPDPKILF